MAYTNAGPSTATNPHPQGLLSNQARRLLGVVTGVNMNATGDTTMLIQNSTNWSVQEVIVTNASVSLTTAKLGVYTQPGATGTTILANTTALTGNTGSTVVNSLSSPTTTLQTTPYLYLNVGTAQGAAATADVYIYGFDFSSIT